MELDEKRMTIPLPMPAVDLATAALLVLFAAAGLAAGLAHFHMVALTARAVTAGNLARSLAATAGRFALTGPVLVVAALQGAGPLLAAAAGLLAGRRLVMRREGRSAE